MNFAEALIEARNGHRIQRSGWNGKGMWVALTPASVIRLSDDRRAGLAAMAERGVQPSQVDVHLGPEVAPSGLEVAPLHLRGALAVLAVADRPAEIRIGAHLDMRAADGSLTIGWAPSQPDMLADDWSIVDSMAR